MAIADCPSESRLRAFLLGEGNPADLEAIGEHLEACPNCELRAREWEPQVDTLLRGLRDDSQTPSTREQAPDSMTLPSFGAKSTIDAASRSIDPARTWKPTDPSSRENGASERLDQGTIVRYFGDYEIRRELGRGGMGVVYEARQVSLNRRVALKMIKSGVLAGHDDLRRFQTEAEAVALLDHPGIVPVHEVGDHDGQRYFSMKLVPGGSLVPRLRSFHDDPKAAARLVAEAAEAVQHAHSRGILHRDLKPANLLIDADGHPYVTDFGLAKRIQDDVELTASGAILGTPAYMSPEQAHGRRGSITIATDVYGLGAILYALLTSKAPFKGDSVVETLQAVKEQPPEPPRKLNSLVPRDLETICLKCLEKDPRRRYTSAQGLADDLHAWLESRPIAARRVGAVERAALWCRRKPAITALVGVVLLAVFGGASATIAVQADANRKLADKNADLTDSLRREAQANSDLSAANTRVRQRYELAVDAIKTLHTGVSEDFLLKQKQFKEVRDPLLKSASDFYGKLGAVLGKESDLDSRRALWQANFEVAQLTGMVGRTEDALAAHQAVLARREALASEPTAAPEAKADVGRSLTAIASLLQSTGKTSEAEASYRRAEAVLVDLARSAPLNPEVRTVLASCRSGLGALLSATGKDANALVSYQRALADQETLANAPGASKLTRRDMADTMARIGILLSRIGKPREAEAEYRAALAMQRTMVDENRTGTDFRNRLADTHNNLAGLLANTGQRAEAETELRTGLALRQTLADENPAVADFRSRLAASRHNLGTLLKQQGQMQEAEAEHRAALQLQQTLADEYPKVTEFRSRLAISHLEIGILLAESGKPSEAEPDFRAALLLQQTLADEHPDVTEFQSYLANSRHNFGILLAESGKPTEAEVEYRAALEISQTLVDHNPDVTEFQSRLANSHNILGGLLSETGKETGAEAEYRVAQAILRTLVDHNPDVSEFRSRLGHSHNDLGILLFQRSRMTEAEAEYRAAQTLQRTLTDENPDVTKLQGDLARSRSNLGLVLQKTGKLREAEIEFREAQAISQKLADTHPNVDEFRSSLAKSGNNLGKLLAQTNEAAEAEAELRKALGLYRTLVKDTPEVPSHRSDLAWSLNNLGNLLANSGKLSEAEVAHSTALSIRQDLVDNYPKVTTYRGDLASSTRRHGMLRLSAGDLAGAVADARKAAALYEELTSRSVEEGYELACCHAVLASAAGREGSEISVGEGKAEADRAMSLLRQAIEMGYRDAGEIKREGALDPLRNRPDFQILMMDLAMPAEPFTP